MSKLGFQDHRSLDGLGLNGKRVTVKSQVAFTASKRTITSDLPKGYVSLEDGLSDDFDFKSIHPAKKRKLMREMTRENRRFDLKR